MNNIEQEKRKKILLVEDEPIIALFESKILHGNNYDVITAENGEQAISLFYENNDIDLILMDIDLGAGMDGTEAAQIILGHQEIPVVFLSSHTNPMVVEKTEKITSYGYVVKNTGETVLMASIRMAFKLFYAKHQSMVNEIAFLESKEKYRLLSENSSDLVMLHDSDGSIIYLSPSVKKITGHEHVSSFHHDYNDYIYQEDKQLIDQMKKDIINNKKVDPFVFRIFKKNGDLIWLKMSITVILDENDEVYNFISSSQNITSEIEKEKTFKHYEKVFDEISAVPMLWLYGDGKIFKTNKKFCDVMLYSKKDLINKSYNKIIHKNSKNKNFELKDHPDSIILKDKDGNSKNVHATTVEYEMDDEKYYLIYIHFNEVDPYLKKGMKSIIKEKDLMLKELIHIVKNDLNVLHSMLSIQTNFEENSQSKTILTEAQRRISIMKNIYDTLFKQINFKEIDIMPVINSLARNVSECYNLKNNVDLTVLCESVTISSKMGFHIAIIVNEIVTNAFKHAFNDGQKKGKIDVKIKKKEKNVLLIDISNDGTPIDIKKIETQSYGFGMALIDMLVKQYKWDMDIDNKKGTRFKIQAYF